jgi:hypothetical protein
VLKRDGEDVSFYSSESRCALRLDRNRAEKLHPPSSPPRLTYLLEKRFLIAEDSGLAWRLLVDEKHELYRGYGMLAASFCDIWEPKICWAYLKAVLHGQKLRQSHGDISQRGGDVLIDPGGMVRLRHVGEGPADRPSVALILERITR